MTVHVCLVSAQAAPNLLPALDPELKPKEVVLLVSQKMRAAADALSMVFKELGIRTDLIPLEDEHSSRVIEETLLQIASEREGEEILLNLTGGTKLMALVAQQTVAQEENWRSFYVDVDTDVVVWLDKTPGKKLAEQLRLRHYLKSYGFDLSDSPERPQITHEQRNLMQTLITQIGSLEKPLTQLNWLTQQAEDKKQLKITMDTQQADSRSLEALLRHFAEAGFLQVNGNTISYADETARNFVKGGWLELYTYSCVVDVTGETGIRDKAAGLEVMSKEGVKNEMDIAMMVRNRLFVIECKKREGRFVKSRNNNWIYLPSKEYIVMKEKMSKSTKIEQFESEIRELKQQIQQSERQAAKLLHYGKQQSLKLSSYFDPRLADKAQRLKSNLATRPISTISGWQPALWENWDPVTSREDVHVRIGDISEDRSGKQFILPAFLP